MFVPFSGLLSNEKQWERDSEKICFNAILVKGKIYFFMRCSHYHKATYCTNISIGIFYAFILLLMRSYTHVHHNNIDPVWIIKNCLSRWWCENIKMGFKPIFISCVHYSEYNRTRHPSVKCMYVTVSNHFLMQDT